MSETAMRPALCPAPTWAKQWGRLRIYALPLFTLLIVALPQMAGGRVRVDSGLYSGLSMHAFDHGTWWTLMAGEVPYFRKPPLVFWIHGIAFELLGRDLWVMRLPGVIAAAGCVMLTVAIMRRLSGPRVALLSGIVFTLYYGFIRYLSRFILDYWHTLFILACVYCVVRAATTPKSTRSGGWLVVLSGVFIGLAMMCKPLSAILALPILAAWLIAVGRAGLAWWILPAMLAAVVVAGPWHVSMVVINGDAFVNEYFGRQALDRGTGEAFETEPWWWYFGYLLRNYWPWMLTLVAGLFVWMRSSAARRRDRQLVWLEAIWCGAWFVLLSLFSDKRDRYMLHLTPMLAGVSAVWLARYSPHWLRRGAQWWLDLCLGAAVVIAAGLMVAPVHINEPEEHGWSEAYDYIRAHDDQSYYIGSIAYRDAGKVYMNTGIWPLPHVDEHGDAIKPPPGALVIYHNDRQPRPDPNDAVVFDEGVISIVRAAGR